MTDHLTPFVISHYDVFETHILSRLNTPEIARARCPCGNDGAIPASFVGNLVCSQLNRTFRSLVPKYQEMDISQCANCKKFLCDYHHLARCKKCEAVALLC